MYTIVCKNSIFLGALHTCIAESDDSCFTCFVSGLNRKDQLYISYLDTVEP